MDTEVKKLIALSLPALQDVTSGGRPRPAFSVRGYGPVSASGCNSESRRVSLRFDGIRLEGGLVEIPV